MHVRLLLTQHFLAAAAHFMLRSSLSRGSGHSMLLMSVDFKPIFRRILHQLTECETKRTCAGAANADAENVPYVA